jgi:hypothetical protein
MHHSNRTPVGHHHSRRTHFSWPLVAVASDRFRIAIELNGPTALASTRRHPRTRQHGRLAGTTNRFFVD